ncbi:hypothetical protein [Pseudomonas sp. TMB3-21]
MTKKTEEPDLKWYEVLEPSYIGDRLCQVGEQVQYAGEVGSNLKPISAKEVKAHQQEEQEPEEEDLNVREADLNKRESDVAEREKLVATKEEEINGLAEANDLRAKELDDREEVVAAKEKALIEKTKK